MFKSTGRLLGSLAVAAAIALPFATSARAADDTIKVGILHSLSPRHRFTRPRANSPYAADYRGICAMQDAGRLPRKGRLLAGSR